MSSVYIILIVFLILLVAQYFLAHKSINALFLLFRSIVPMPLPYIFIAIIFFPGTLIHELSHFFTAIVLFLKVRGIHLLPSWNEDSLTLGHVTYESADFIRGFLVGTAPLPVALTVLWFLYQWLIVTGFTTVPLLICGYLTFAITTTMFSSQSDLTDGMAVLVLLAVVFVALLFFQVNVLYIANNFFIGSGGKVLTGFLYVLNIYLGIGIGIHSLIYFVLRGILRIGR